MGATTTGSTGTTMDLSGSRTTSTWQTRLCHHRPWVRSPRHAWLLFCGQNGGDGYFRANGATVAQSTTGIGVQRLCVNCASTTQRARSDWAVAEIITWDYALSLEEIEDVELHLGNRFSPLAPTPQPTAQTGAGADARGRSRRPTARRAGADRNVRAL